MIIMRWHSWRRWWRRSWKNSKVTESLEIIASIGTKIIISICRKVHLSTSARKWFSHRQNMKRGSARVVSMSKRFQCVAKLTSKENKKYTQCDMTDVKCHCQQRGEHVQKFMQVSVWCVEWHMNWKLPIAIQTRRSVEIKIIHIINKNNERIKIPISKMMIKKNNNSSNGRATEMHDKLSDDEG